MYSLNLPVSVIRTKIRQQFEQHRFVNQLNVVDVLLFQSNAEFQVSVRLLMNTVGFERYCLQSIVAYRLNPNLRS